jgi:hypothetical protein
MKQIIRLRESELKHMISESVKRVLNEMYPEYYNSDGGVNAGYSGRDGYGNLHGYVSRDEAQMRRVFQKLKNYGKIGYDYFEDWKRAGYPHADEV